MRQHLSISKTKEELQQELSELKELVRYSEGLPHIFGQRFYPWARRIWDSTSPDILLCAANQLGKSTIAIRKNIRLATDPTLWPKFWPNLPKGQAPNLFFYLYPTLGVAQTEWETKWLPLHMPRGEFKNHPQFGWREEYEKGQISKIFFNTGVVIQFKAYSIKVSSLQTATVYHCTADEELPVDYLPEIKARLNASDGLFLMVFTATLGQDYWRRAMEPSTESEEVMKDALKLQVSLYNSMMFDDGTPSHWTAQKIQRAIANCPTEAEIQRRVYGRFVKSEGLLYSAFAVGKNMAAPSRIPQGWSIWSGVDVGSGGQSGHPAAIVFVAASEDFKRGRVFRGWRGDGIPTTATDIVEKYRELKKGLTLTVQTYDFSSADFFQIASRLGESFVPANKRREAGVQLLNSLFKCGMLTVDRDDPELEKLVSELTSVSHNTRKTARGAIDDMCFVGSTLVMTDRGERPISTLRIGDLVQTQKGMRPVSAVLQSVTVVQNVVTESGEETWVTPNHKYKTFQGEMRAKDLSFKNSCLGLSTKAKPRSISLKASSSGDTHNKSERTSDVILSQVVSTESKASVISTARSSSIFMEILHRATTFIMLIMIRSTMIRRICRRLLPVSTFLVTLESQDGLPSPSEILSKHVRQPDFGTRAKPQSNFTANSQKPLGPIASILNALVSAARRFILWSLRSDIHQDSALTPVNQNGVEIQAWITSKKLVWFAKNQSLLADTVESKPVVAPVRIKAGRKRKIARVYNITVENDHEYFANGVLVANCDALRYTCMSIPWNFDGFEDTVSIEDQLALDLKPKPQKTDVDYRREWAMGKFEDPQDDVQDEFDFWNDISGA